MKNGYLSQYFMGVAVKRLSAVEADTVCSHQHEFNGVKGLRGILGEPDNGVRFDTRFIYLTDQDDEPVIEDGFLTWYDARQKARIERQVMRWEYRLYFPDNSVLQLAAAGDLLIVAKEASGRLLAIVAEGNTTIDGQLRWLFGFSEDTHPGFSVRSELETEQDRIGFAARFILEQIGIVLESEEPNYLDQMLQKFNGAFPGTVEFSYYTRSTIPDVRSQDDPDAALIAWMEREEILYRTLEKYLVGEKLRNLVIQEQSLNPEPFFKLVQSTLQRRKSRAGSALENHLEQIFIDYGISYTRQGITENRLKPDFIFPGIVQYHNTQFPEVYLTMLASKSTCKDRWRQILNEASRIPLKHLVTLEPGISEHQTDEMKMQNVQLVIPEVLQATFTDGQQRWLMSLANFTQMVLSRNNACSGQFPVGYKLQG